MANPKKQKKGTSKTKHKSKGPSLTFKQKMQAEWQSRRPVLMFWGGFAGLVLLFFIFTASGFYVDYIFQPIVEAFAWAGSGLLNLFGQGTTARAEVVSSDIFSINISKGCDGLAPIALLVAGILIYPSAWKYKWPALIAGPVILIFLNLIRIVSLFLIGAYAPKLFDVMHIEVWQAIFIIIAVVLWLIWLNWVMKKLKSSVEVVQ